MSRELEIEGRMQKIFTVEDIAPKGMDELRELCKATGPHKGFTRAPVQSQPLTPELLRQQIHRQLDQ